MARRALLLGLDAYKDENLRLEAPRHDVDLVTATLRVLGYPADCLSCRLASRDEGLTTADLNFFIGEFLLREAKEDDEVFLYISGHGVEQDGGRLIVPTDYRRARPMAPSQLLTDHWIYGMARRSTALSVLVIADACREGVRLELTADDVSKSIVAQDEDKISVDAPTIAILYSCAPGTESFAPSKDGPSYFTQAFCQALREDENLATLEELLGASARLLPSLLPAGRSQIPHIDERHQIEGRAGRPLALIVKENLAARLRQRIANSDWCKKLRELCLWACVEAASSGWRGRWKRSSFAQRNW